MTKDQTIGSPIRRRLIDDFIAAWLPTRGELAGDPGPMPIEQPRSAESRPTTREDAP